MTVLMEPPAFFTKTTVCLQGFRMVSTQSLLPSLG